MTVAATALENEPPVHMSDNETPPSPVSFDLRDAEIGRLAQLQRGFRWSREVERLKTELDCRRREIIAAEQRRAASGKLDLFDACFFVMMVFVIMAFVGLVGFALGIAVHGLLGLFLSRSEALIGSCILTPTGMGAAGGWLYAHDRRKSAARAALPFAEREPQLVAGHMNYTVTLGERVEGACAHVTLTRPDGKRLDIALVLGDASADSELISERFHKALSAVEQLRSKAELSRERALTKAGLLDEQNETAVQRMLIELTEEGRSKQLTAGIAQSLNAYAAEQLAS